jgi:phosphoglycerol transferase MdoB-like AlkP superfamily enzyme
VNDDGYENNDDNDVNNKTDVNIEECTYQAQDINDAVDNTEVVDQGHNNMDDFIKTNDATEEDALEEHNKIMDQANNLELNLELEIMEVWKKSRRLKKLR